MKNISNTYLQNNNDSQQKVDTLTKFANLLLILGPILQTYGWGKFNFAFILTIIAGIIYLIGNGINNSSKAPSFLWIYLFYWLIIHIITANDIITAIPLGQIRLLLISLLFYGCFDKELALRNYRWIAAICIIFFYIQEISYAIAGVRISGIFQNLPFAIDTDQMDLIDKLQNLSRSASFFSEPAILAQFLLPLLAIELFNCTKLFHWVKVGIILLTLLLLKSGNGIWGTIIILSLFSLYTTINIHIKAIYKVLVFLLFIIGFIGVSLYIQTESGEEIAYRYSNVSISANKTTDGSAYLRIYRGYDVFADYTPKEKIFGTDNFEAIRNHMTRSFWSFGDKETYVNTVQSILLHTGCIGALLFSIMLIQIFKRSDFKGKVIVLCLVGLMFISANFFSYIMYIFLLMANQTSTECYERV